MTKRKVPQRMCVGCQEMKSKKELIRVVKSKGGRNKLRPHREKTRTWSLYLPRK